jgi:hypothetical protein
VERFMPAVEQVNGSLFATQVVMLSLKAPAITLVNT